MNQTAPLIIALLLSAVLTSNCQAQKHPFIATPIAEFNEPWAMTFLPDGRILVTEKRGQLFVVTQNGTKSEEIEEVPDVAYRGQGGLGDVIIHPDFENNGLIYLSYAESGVGNTRGAAVARARLVMEDDQEEGALEDLVVIWRQNPKVTDDGHYGHRMAFDADGYLFITSGERQKFDPAQQMTGNLGKVVRLHDDGSVPDDNPFADQGDVTAEIWSLGHRNPLGIAFAPNGQLWIHEMGPRHGDEFNLVKKGANYGYPIVSEGDHYSGAEIPDHDTRPEFEAPRIAWIPTAAPAGLIFYTGEMFPGWQGSALLGGLRSRSLIRVEIEGESASEAERFEMEKRIREVEQGPDGAVWILEDRDGGRLLKLTPPELAPIQDPVAYCAETGDSDVVSRDRTGGAFPDSLATAMVEQGLISDDEPAQARQASQWRCMGGNVWVCPVGANLPCGEKADLSREPTAAMTDFCKQNPGAGMPAYVTGRATIFSWTCDGATPAIENQAFTADAAGYLSEFWHEV